MCTVGSVSKRRVAIIRTLAPIYIYSTNQEINLFVLVLCPPKQKCTKRPLEIGRTFATLLNEDRVLKQLIGTKSKENFKKIIDYESNLLMRKYEYVNSTLHVKEKYKFSFCSGFKEDFTRRIKYYISDYRDGVSSAKAFQKVISCTCFLYFSILLPNIAFGSLNAQITNGKIDVQKVIFGQMFGGIFFGLFGGQPLLILMTTAPISLYTKILYEICSTFDIDFSGLYCCVGLWNSFFLILYSIFDASLIMKWSRRSCEEIFGLFITCAFFIDSLSHVYREFQINYHSPACKHQPIENGTINDETEIMTEFNNSDIYGSNRTEIGFNTICRQDSSLLYLILVLSTVWVGLTIFKFKFTTFFKPNLREFLADYSLPFAVIFVSFIGSYVFGNVKLNSFQFTSAPLFSLAPVYNLSLGAIFAAMGLGFCVSILFFMDQNISAAMVNMPLHKLKKGPAYHMDLSVTAILNLILSLSSLPWMHAAIPHSPLHARNLAEYEQHADEGRVYDVIVKVHETRLATLLAHIMIGFSLLLLPYPLAYIPNAVLDGLFLFVAITALYGNQFFERLLLLITDQASYPNVNYIHRVPQKKIHLFTLFQVIQLLILCGFGFSSFVYLKMFFPVILFFFIPIRQMLIPLIVEKNYLEIMDNEN